MKQQQKRHSAVTVFYSYAHADEELRERLARHLSPLKREGLIAEWYDRQIPAGTNRAQNIDENLETASIILLLISVDFLASDYCYGIELQRALARHETGEAQVIPILLREVALDAAPFAHLQSLPRSAKPVTSWNNQDEALAEIARELRQVIEHVRDPEQVGREERTVWNVLYKRHPFFTGREVLLKDLHDRLTTTEPTALTQPQAICGLGGIGKTQIAVEYACRYRDEYRFVLWARAATREKLIADFVAIANLLDLSGKDEKDQNIIVDAVKRWLANHTNWLLILDNADDLNEVKDFLPTGDSGHVLLTTRASATGTTARSIKVSNMDSEEGALLLLRRAQLLKANAPLEQATKEEQALAKEIAHELDGLPLALVEAGAYIEETGCGLKGYLKLYREHRKELLQRPRGHPTDHPEPVSTTWSLNFQKVAEANPAAADLLRLCAFLDPDAIPEEIITKGAPELGDVLEPVAADPVKLNEAMEELRNYSLVRREKETLIVHRLVQAVFKDKMDDQTQQLWATRTVRAVNAAFPEVAYQTWPDCQRYVLHAQACDSLVEKYELAFPEAAQLLTRAGCYLRQRALYTQAEPLLKRAQDILEQVLGPQHPEIARTLSELGSLYRLQGPYAQAEPLLKRAQDILEQVLGPQHPEIARTLSELASLYRLQGRYAQAESLLNQALDIREQVLDPQHPEIADTLNNLADLYYLQGKYEQVEQLYQNALDIIEETSGSEHPDIIANTLDGLALLYRAQGKYEQAKKHFQKALAIKEGTLGSEHPSTAITHNHLALLYQSQGQYKQAEQHYQKALAIGEKVLKKYPAIAFTFNDLASLYHAQGKYEQAEQHYREALAIKEEELGPRHPGTATTLGFLALLSQEQGRYKQAEQLYQDALDINKETRGPEHPSTATTLSNFGLLYLLQGRYAQAETLLNQARTIRERVLGPQHPDTATTLRSLAMLYRKQGKYEQAEPLYQRALAIEEQKLGPEHPDTAVTLRNLAQLYRKQGKYEQAEPFYQRALDIQKQVLGSNHPETAVTLRNLAQLYRKQGRYEQAESLYQRALAIQKQVLGLEHPDTVATQRSYTKLLRGMKRKKK